MSRKKLVFISYRRADTDALAGRIKDRMATVLPNWDAFLDVSSILPGADFRVSIDDRLQKSSVLLVLIGEKWSVHRLQNADDVVRYEIAAGLRMGMRILPVLANEAKMPSKQDLPEDIAALANLNAIGVRHARFDDDVLNLATAVSGAPIKRRPRLLSVVVRFLVGAVIGSISAFIGLIIHHEATGSAISERIGDDGATLVLPLISVIGGLVAIWLGRPVTRSA